MSIKFTEEELYFRNEQTGELVPAPTLFSSADKELSDKIDELDDAKMERYVIRLVKNSDNTYKMTSLDDEDLTFNEVYEVTKKLNEYVVIVYGNSKLRPQYVSTNEMMFIGIDRSTETKVLRILYTPIRLIYETFRLVEQSDLNNYMPKSQLMDTGIKSISWAVVRSEITVTTVEDIYKQYRPEGTNTRYWAEFDGCPYFKNRQLYKVTFNDDVYDNIVCDYGILDDDGTGSVVGSVTSVGGAWQLIGNKYLYDSRYEDTGEPFCIMYVEHGGMHQQGSYYYSSNVGKGILLTRSASSNTLKIERATIAQDELPKSLFNNYGYGDRTYQNIANSSYPRTSLGQGNIVGRGGFAIGNSNISIGQFSIAMGGGAKAIGSASFALGYNTISSGNYGSFAEGYGSNASGDSSHAEGRYTRALSTDQHVQGKYNALDSASKYAHIVGNGTSDTARSNAHTLDWNGNAWYQGKVESASGVLKLRNTEVNETQLQQLLTLLN